MKNTTLARSLPDNATVEACLPLVKAVTARIRATRGAVGSFEDLYASGLDGLLDAAERFDPTRGVAFTTFAYYRIRGAILDGLRRGPSVSVRTSASIAPALLTAEAANDNATAEPRAPAPTDSPRWREPNAAFVVALDDMDALPDERLRPADEEVDERHLVVRIQAALKKLSAEDRHILELHYYEELTFAQIGQRLGICKPWAFRRHRRALARLREAMGMASDKEPELVDSDS